MSLRIFRLIVLISGLVLGILGVIIIAILSVFMISKIRSLDTPYLSPLVPFLSRDFKQNIFSRYIFKKFERNKDLDPIDNTRGYNS